MNVTQVQLNTLWIGPRLPPLHLACLLSAIRAGHKVRLFCYARPDNLPAEIELADAEEVLKKTDIVRHRKSDSPSLSSNRFRYLLFQKRLGAWIDTDVFVVRPLTSQDGYMMAWQDTELIGSAVLHLPGGQLTDFLCNFTRQTHPIPFWYSPVHRQWLKLRKAVGAPLAAGDHRWGVYGPHLLTGAVHKYDLLDKVQPSSTCYPVGWRDAETLYKGNSDIFATLPESTQAVHLWQHLAGTGKHETLPIQTGSFVDQAYRMVDMKRPA